MGLFALLFSYYHIHTFNVAREDRIDVFQAVGCRKHIHGIFDTIGRREHIHCISKKKMRLTSNSDCAHYLIDKLEFSNFALCL